jgi:hypothetical protein
VLGFSDSNIVGFTWWRGTSEGHPSSSATGSFSRGGRGSSVDVKQISRVVKRVMRVKKHERMRKLKIRHLEVTHAPEAGGRVWRMYSIDAVESGTRGSRPRTPQLLLCPDRGLLIGCDADIIPSRALTIGGKREGR